MSRGFASLIALKSSKVETSGNKIGGGWKYESMIERTPIDADISVFLFLLFFIIQFTVLYWRPFLRFPEFFGGRGEQLV